MCGEKSVKVDSNFRVLKMKFLFLYSQPRGPKNNFLILRFFNINIPVKELKYDKQF